MHTWRDERELFQYGIDPNVAFEEFLLKVHSLAQEPMVAGVCFSKFKHWNLSKLSSDEKIAIMVECRPALFELELFLATEVGLQ